MAFPVLFGFLLKHAQKLSDFSGITHSLIDIVVLVLESTFYNWLKIIARFDMCFTIPNHYTISKFKKVYFSVKCDLK